MDGGAILVGLSNTIHIVATVIWIGWSLMLVTTVAPEAATALAPESTSVAARLLRRAPLAYLALAVLGGTGLYQMAANAFYVDFLTLTNRWSQLLFVKHLAVIGNIALMLILALSVVPELRLAALAAARGRGDPARLAALSRRLRLVAWLNLAANGIVILTTGLMTALQP